MEGRGIHLKTLRVAVIGCGSIAQHRHLPEYEQNPHTTIVAVCDPVEERAKKVAKLYGAIAYTDHMQLLEKEEIDLVSVCTPNAYHAPISIDALKAGTHVLCEKPMATSAEECEAMIKAEEEAGMCLMIGHNQRFVSSHEKARQLIAKGDIGKIYSFRTTFGHGGPEGWSVDGENSWFFKKDQAFIGAMGDLGVHKADLLRYLLGEEVVEVGAFVTTSAKQGDVDDNAVAILKTESGIVGTLTASWSYVAKEDNSTILYGENAILRLEDDPHYSLIVHYKNGETVKYELGQIQSNDEGGQTDSRVIAHFVNSVLEGKEPPISGKEGYASLNIILAAMEASRTGRTIKL